MQEKREFTGVWMPKEVLLDTELTSDEKILFADIASFENCFVLNKTFAQRYGCSERTIQNRLKNLKTKGFIKEKSFNGRERILQAMHVFAYQTRNTFRGRGEESFTPEVQDLSPIDNNIDNIKKTEDAFASIPGNSLKPNTPRGWTNRRRAEVGKPPLYTPRTEKQTETFEALKFKDYFREQGYAQHGMQFFKVRNAKRESVVSKLIINAYKELGDLKPLIDWWFEGSGDWAGYEPEQCFKSTTIERFSNKGKNKKITNLNFD